MSYRPHGRAEVDPTSPRAFAVCDKCGFWTNQYKLSWQRQWAGATQINIRVFSCEDCLDELQPQLKTIILPADPAPIIDARVEAFSLDEITPIIDRKGAQVLDRSANAIQPRGP